MSWTKKLKAILQVERIKDCHGYWQQRNLPDKTEANGQNTEYKKQLLP